MSQPTHHSHTSTTGFLAYRCILSFVSGANVPLYASMALHILRLPSFNAAFSVGLLGYGTAMLLSHVFAAQLQTAVGEVTVTVGLGFLCFLGGVVAKRIVLTELTEIVPSPVRRRPPVVAAFLSMTSMMERISPSERAQASHTDLFDAI